MTHPTEICFLLHVGLEEFTVGPITHGTKSHFAFHECLDRLIPTLSRMIRINVIQHFGELPHGAFDLRVVPLHRTGEQIAPTFWSDHSKKRVLKELGGGPNPGIPDSQSRNAGRLLSFFHRMRDSYGRMPATLTRSRYNPVTAVKYSVFASASPMQSLGFGKPHASWQNRYSSIKKVRYANPPPSFLMRTSRFGSS